MGMAALMQVLFVAFPNTYDSKILYTFNFTYYSKSLFSVFVFFTGDNNPDIFLKNYPNNSAITTSVIAMIWVHNIILVGVLIGLSFYKMRDLMYREIKRLYEKPDKLWVFNSLSNNPDASKRLVKSIVAERMMNKRLTYQEVDRIVSMNTHDKMETTKASQEIYGLLRVTFGYEALFSMINALITIVALVVIHFRAFDKYQFFIASIALCCISLFDFFNKFFFFDLTLFSRILRSVFDTILNFAIIGLSLTLILDSDYTYHLNHKLTVSLIKIWAFLSLCKLFRPFLLFFRFDRQRVKAHILYPFIRYFYELFGLGIVLLLIFGTLGHIIFGGNIHSYTMDQYNKTMGTQYEYHHLNFNTLPNSLITLFAMLSNNGWTVIANISVLGNGSLRRVMKFFFTFFKFTMNYLLANSLIAVTIKIFSEFEFRQQQQLRLKLAKYGKRVIQEPIRDEDYSDAFEGELTDNEELNSLKS